MRRHLFTFAGSDIRFMLDPGNKQYVVEVYEELPDDKDQLEVPEFLDDTR